MRNLILLTLSLLLVACGDSDSPTDMLPDELTGPADLVINSISVNGDISRNAEGQGEIPIALVVRNRGGEAAGEFKIAVNYEQGGNNADVAFRVPPDNGFYPFVDGLASGEERTLTGTLVFNAAVGGLVKLTASADSCAGEKIVLIFCRVDESNEDNNDSKTIEATIPTKIIIGPIIKPVPLEPIPIIEKI